MSVKKLLFSALQFILDIIVYNLSLSVLRINSSFEVRAFLSGTVVSFFFFSSLYGFANWTLWDEIKHVMRSTLYSFLVCVLFLYAGKNNIPFFALFLASAIFIPSSLLLRYFLRIILFRSGLLSTSLIILGAGNAGEIFAQNIQSSPFIMRKVLGFLDDDNDKQGLTVSGVKVLGKLADFEKVQNNLHADEAVIAIPTASRKLLSDILDKIEELSPSVLYVPDMYMLTTMSAEIRSIDGMPVISASQGLLNPLNRFVKSLVDYIGGITALILSSPLMLYAAW